MSENWKPKKIESKFTTFLYHNNHWFWSTMFSLLFIITYFVCQYLNYSFIDNQLAETFISGHFAIIGFILTVATFMFSSKAGIGLVKNKPHGNVFFKVLVITAIYSLMAIIIFMFTKNALLVYMLTIASLSNMIVAFYYLYFSLKNFSENPDSTL